MHYPSQTLIETTDAKKNSGLVLRILAGVICLIVFIFSVTYLIRYYKDSKESQDGIADLKNIVIQSDTGDTGEAADLVDVNGRMVQMKFANLYAQNPDFVGWITIPGTKIDYPVMQNMEENEYYINRNFDQEWDASGLPFLDNRCSYMDPATDNLLIYGHNMKAGTMFAGITNYKDQEYYEQHPTLIFSTLESDDEYEIIAAFYSQVFPEEDTTSFKYYTFFDAANADEFDAYVKQVKDLTSYDIEADASYGDTLITLSTCAYQVKDGRFAIVARKIEEE